ncbi:MAG: T9SS type A sorting domain-containing protein [Flavobacteriales bacterium]|nr:T9SS type A sorting domain-containing protein [Flavobacteriales bacterium]
MKRVLHSLFTLVLAVGFAATASAQLPDGSTAPDFTATDINGTEWNLQSLLDDGWTVILDISATWCGPCWSYHNSGILEEIYAEHGPDGDGTIMVFMIEGDETTTLEDIQGTGSDTQGDWTAGTPYPIIDDAGIADDYAITYFPTIYTICPDGILTETGQASLEEHFFAAFIGCELASDANDPMLYGYTGDAASCGEANISVEMYNFGTETLTSATIEASVGGVVMASTDWTGSVATYESTIVEVGTISTSGVTNVEISITTANDNTGNDMVEATIYEAASATTEIHVDIATDCWGDELSWELVNSSGTVVASGSGYASETSYNEVHWVATDCYTFNAYDAYGDGLNGTSWPNSCSVDGSIHVWSANDDGSNSGDIFDYDGSYWYSAVFAAADVNTVVGVEEVAAAGSFSIYPNPVNDVATVNFNVANATDVTVDVINMVGQKVISSDFGTVVAGEHVETIDFSNLDAGIYMVNMTANGEVTTVKVTVTK